MAEDDGGPSPSPGPPAQAPEPPPPAPMGPSDPLKRGIAMRVDITKSLLDMVTVMNELVGNLGVQGHWGKVLTMENLPLYLEENAKLAREIIKSLPERDDAEQPKEPDPVSEDLWKLVVSKKSGKVLGILPENDVAERWFAEETEHEIVSKKAISSYDAAVNRCREKVESIIKDCRRKNQKYKDTEFALDDELVCLRGLVPDPDGDPFDPPPQSHFRTRNIFPSPKLFVNGARANDIQQGTGGDCWFLAAVAALTNLDTGLSHNYIHVDGDEEVGVYGFVFHRDGEWIYEIVDDFLYCKNPMQGHLNMFNDDDANAPGYNQKTFEWRLLKHMGEESYRKTFLSGADALYFSQSRDENETWLPLLEKAYAKAHGDYQSIEGGFTGEAIEDLTGGITTEIKTEDILDVNRMWEELLRCNQEFIFGCWTPRWADGTSESQGLRNGHAYSIMRALEIDIKGVPTRLVLVRNPWGDTEWNGPYSDGSKEWTIDLIQKLDHQFGDDGIFWMSFQDLLRKFSLFDRTRLIGPEWSCAQCWTNISVPRQFRFLETKYTFTMDQDDRTVISLSQLDDRYIRGLEGPYVYSVEFRLEKDNAKEGEDKILARSSSSYNTRRSVNAELDLEAGSYSLYLKIKAEKWPAREPVKKAAGDFLKGNTKKFVQIAKKYNLAFMKSGLGDEERIMVPLNDVHSEETKDEEKSKPVALTPASTDVEPPMSPDGRGMDNVDDVRDQVVVSTDEPVENPTTQQPNALIPAPPKKKDPKDDWDPIATVGLRLLTRKAVVKLSVVDYTPPSDPRVVVSRQSFPVGDLPPVASLDLEALKAVNAGRVVKKEEVKGDDKQQETYEIDATDPSKLPDTLPPSQAMPVTVDRTETYLNQPEPVPEEARPLRLDAPRNFRVRF